LAAWAEQFDATLMRPGVEASNREAKAAIRRIGTNSLPILLGLLRAKDSPIKARLRNHLPRPWHQRLGLVERAPDARRVGCHAFAALATNASAALPELVEIARHHPDADGRFRALFAMQYLEATAESAIPFLIQCLTNGVSEVRAGAASSLGSIQCQPEVVVPALIQHFQMANASLGQAERFVVVFALGQFGTNARSAVPLIRPLLNDPVFFVRLSATQALQQIDGQTLIEIP
jgi:hypothetical protein